MKTKPLHSAASPLTFFQACAHYIDFRVEPIAMGGARPENQYPKIERDGRLKLKWRRGASWPETMAGARELARNFHVAGIHGWGVC